MMITGKSYIGRELSGKGNVHYRTFNSNEEKENHWNIVEVVREEIDSALIKAKQAFLSLGKITEEGRSKFLREIANQLDEHRDELYEVYMAES
ncbi:MAG: aldehyde dehydrogenase family protein, partial [Bacteroidetes bacterium]